MPNSILNYRWVMIAALLGLVAIATNLLSYSSFPDLHIPAGLVFLYWSALCLGTSGAMISLLIAGGAEVLTSGDYFGVLRIVVSVLMVGLTSEKFPKIPAYLVVLATWMAIIIPAAFSVPDSVLASSVGLFDLRHFESHPENIWISLFLGCILDVTLALISGTLLLNQSLWASLTTRIRPLSINYVLLHVASLISMLTMICTVGLTTLGHLSSETERFDQFSIGGAALLLAVSVILPSAFVWLTGNRLKSACQDFYPGSLLPQARPHGFSGLSSEYWRRKESADHNPSTVLTRDPSRISGVHSRQPGQQFSADSGICVVNSENIITFANRKFAAFIQVSDPADLLNKPLAEVGMPDLIRDPLRHLLERTRAKGPRTTELKLNQLPNPLRFFELTSQLGGQSEHSSIASSPNSIVIVVKDITERRSVESHLLQAQKLGSLGNVAAGLAHAFDESLKQIDQELNKLPCTNLSPEARAAHAEIKGSLARLGTLVHHLIDFAEGRPQDAHDEDLVVMVNERIELLRRMVGDQCSIELTSSQAKLPVSADPNLVMQALTNLVLNAREAYSENAGTIQVSLDLEEFDDDVEDLFPGASAGRFARLRVRDSGQGMSPETLAKAFDPLFSTKRSSGHSGLGLSIAFAIVKAHDGFLTVESKPERGTTVSMYIPLSSGKALAAGRELQEKGQVSDSGALIQ